MVFYKTVKYNPMHADAIFTFDIIISELTTTQNKAMRIYRKQQILALLKAQVSLQLGNVSSSDNGVSVCIMYSYMY